ncbi:thymopoietin isoform X3 [Falco biarmicus]|uniref:thymopoietin isoform X3 n=1 Tax=Falco cherrug TaxID=345164 RepID=UPI002478447E|nr:thymopoietin isoform X3 [Falco cherrug]XP_055663952.1 thymopoietin isoform X3 [Falco peregrinus]XP_056196203.1 thymopoietin isoform X3 [Falco biarmicus]
MSEFLADPSVLTKEKLKSELIANNVSLPGGEQRKDVYVQLYLQHLTARNPPAAAQPDFSSDEERELTPLGARNRGAAVGRKATKKTDKPRPEEKDDLDVTEMSNEDLQEQLVKYGLNPGPIVATTRKLYEKKLLKLMEQGPELKAPVPFPEISSAPENTRQNGSNDSDQYSDNEEEPKTELRLEKREPLKARTKTPVALKQRRVVEHNQVDATAQLPVDDAVISESTPIAETILTASNETLVVNRVPGNFKHAAPTLSISELSEMPRRTPKKPLMTAEQEETDCPRRCFFNHVGHNQSCDLLNTAMMEETAESTECFKTPKVTRQLPLRKFKLTSKTQEVLERTHTEEGRVERDILKEMFPYEVSTPTGISASCRRPIKGAASRPIEHSDFRMEESFSKYAPKYGTSTDIKSEKPPTKKERSIPLWIKVLLFVVISVFLVLVYQSMETNQGNPFSKYLNMVSRGGAK